MSATATPIAYMIDQMHAASVPHDMIVLAVATVERACQPSTTMSTGAQVDIRQEKRRLSWRLKKHKWRSKCNNSPPASTDRPVDVSTTGTVDTVDMSTSSSLSLPSSLKKEKISSEREARARAKPCPPVDIPADWRPSVEGERFAADRGFTPAEIADVAFKFKNHFSATGERRRDWSKAWLSWVIDERRPPNRQRQLPLYATIQGGKGAPLREARRFTEADWRQKYAFIAGDPTHEWPEKYWGPAPGNPGCLIPESLLRELMTNHPMPNRGGEQCMAQAQ